MSVVTRLGRKGCRPAPFAAQALPMRVNENINVGSERCNLQGQKGEPFDSIWRIYNLRDLSK